MNPKKKYAKPTVKLAKWELNEAICQKTTIMQISPNRCFDVKVDSGNSHNSVIQVTQGNNDIRWDWTKP